MLIIYYFGIFGQHCSITHNIAQPQQVERTLPPQGDFPFPPFTIQNICAKFEPGQSHLCLLSSPPRPSPQPIYSSGEPLPASIPHQRPSTFFSVSVVQPSKEVSMTNKSSRLTKSSPPTLPRSSFFFRSFLIQKYQH